MRSEVIALSFDVTLTSWEEEEMEEEEDSSWISGKALHTHTQLVGFSTWPNNQSEQLSLKTNTQELWLACVKHTNNLSPSKCLFKQLNHYLGGLAGLGTVVMSILTDEATYMQCRQEVVKVDGGSWPILPPESSFPSSFLSAVWFIQRSALLSGKIALLIKYN